MKHEISDFEKPLDASRNILVSETRYLDHEVWNGARSHIPTLISNFAFVAFYRSSLRLSVFLCGTSCNFVEHRGAHVPCRNRIVEIQ